MRQRWAAWVGVALMLTLSCSGPSSGAPSGGASAGAGSAAAGSGTGGSGAGAAAGSSGAAAPATAIPIEKVPVALSALSATMTPLWVAADAGIFRRYGIDPEFNQLSPAAASQALAAGSVPVAVT